MNQFIPKSGTNIVPDKNKRLTEKFLKGMNQMSLSDQMAILQRLTFGHSIIRNGVKARL